MVCLLFNWSMSVNLTDIDLDLPSCFWLVRWKDCLLWGNYCNRWGI